MKTSYQNPTLKPFGNQAILIDWPEEISEKLLNFILEVKKNIQSKELKYKVEVINTYSSLLIKYSCTIDDIYDEISLLKSLISSLEVPNKTATALFTIPVCYDEKFGLDLDELASRNKLTKSEIIQLHTKPIYTIYFLGFLPGFLYLGGLDERLFISRKKTPRLRVEKGAVGIGEKQTGIYPKISAGGWQLIGNSPLNFFDITQPTPSPFQAGDKLKFKRVSVEEHQLIQRQVADGSFKLKKEVYVL